MNCSKSPCACYQLSIPENVPLRSWQQSTSKSKTQLHVVIKNCKCTSRGEKDSSGDRRRILKTTNRLQTQQCAQIRMRLTRGAGRKKYEICISNFLRLVAAAEHIACSADLRKAYKGILRSCLTARSAKHFGIPLYRRKFMSLWVSLQRRT